MRESGSELFVFLRGQRNYIQGTQIIARLSEFLPEGEWFLEQANFQHIAKSGLKLVFDAQDACGQPVGSVTFRSKSGEGLTFWAVGTGVPAPQRNDEMPISVERAAGTISDVAIWRYRGVACLEDILNVVVQVIKAENGLRWPQAEDIWFTGLRKFDLPLGPNFAAEGTVGLSLYRKLGVSGQIQTIWKIQLRGCNPSGMVTFALKLNGQ